MVFIILFFTLGICSLQLFSRLPSFNTLLFIVGFSGLMLLLLIFVNLCFNQTHQATSNLSCPSSPLRWKFYWQWPQVLKYGLPAVLAFLFGFLLVSWQAWMQLDKFLPITLENKPILLRGKINTIPDENEGKVRFEFLVIESIKGWENPGKILLLWPYPKQVPKMGEEWALTVKLKRPRGFSNPGSFDKEKHFFRNRWVAEGVVVSKGRSERIVEQNLSIVSGCRMAVLQALQKNLLDKNYSGLIIALVVGVTHKITQQQWAVFRETGTSHLMAISGLHVGFMGAFFYGVVGLVWRRVNCPFALPAQWVGAWGGLLGALGYALLAGFSVPTQRALVMLSLYFSSVLLRRKTHVWRNYSIALGLVLLIDPFASLMPGFWLSFAAVGVILYGMQGRLNPQSAWWKWGRVQWVAFLGLIPLSIGFFQQFSWISPLTNLIAIPWVTFLVVPTALISVMLLPLNTSLAQWLQVFSEKLLSGLFPLLEFAAGLPKVSWVAEAEPGFLGIALALIGFLIFIAPRGLPGRWLGLLWCLPLFMRSSPEIASGNFRFTLLDVGQGLAAVVETQHHLLVFDTGPQKGNWDAGERIILPFLRLRGREKIDRLVISHGDLDHIGGMRSLLKNFQVESLLASELEKIHFDKRSHCSAGQQWEWEGVKFEMLHPTRLATRKRNDHSCVLRVSAGRQSLLLTGDIEAKSELELIEQPEKLTASVLVVPHHGSRSSSTEAFIKVVHPEFALFPIGYHNPYGHPKQEVVQRYQAQGINLLDSVCNGAITFLFKDEVTLSLPLLYRQQNQKFWQTEFKAY